MNKLSPYTDTLHWVRHLSPGFWASSDLVLIQRPRKSFCWILLASGQVGGHDIFGTSFSFQCAHSFTHCWLQLVTFWGILDPVSNCQYATPRGLICLLIVGCNYSQIRCRWINSHWIGCCWVWIHCRWFCCLWTVVFGSIVVGSVVVRPVVVESVARNVLQIILASVFHCLLKYIWCCGSMPL